MVRQYSLKIIFDTLMSHGTFSIADCGLRNYSILEFRFWIADLKDNKREPRTGGVDHGFWIVSIADCFDFGLEG